MAMFDQQLKFLQNAHINNQLKSDLEVLIQPTQLVGDVYSLGYNSAKVIIHDKYREQVGGIPSLSFLIATRLNVENENLDFKKEDTSIILLRVMDAAKLPQDAELERIRVETAQRVSGESNHWDSDGVMDVDTRNHLSYAGLECKVIGTSFLRKKMASY